MPASPPRERRQHALGNTASNANREHPTIGALGQAVGDLFGIVHVAVSDEEDFCAALLGPALRVDPGKGGIDPPGADWPE